MYHRFRCISEYEGAPCPSGVPRRRDELYLAPASRLASWGLSAPGTAVPQDTVASMSSRDVGRMRASMRPEEGEAAGALYSPGGWLADGTRAVVPRTHRTPRRLREGVASEVVLGGGYWMGPFGANGDLT